MRWYTPMPSSADHSVERFAAGQMGELDELRSDVSVLVGQHIMDHPNGFFVTGMPQSVIEATGGEVWQQGFLTRYPTRRKAESAVLWWARAKAKRTTK